MNIKNVFFICLTIFLSGCQTVHRPLVVYSPEEYSEHIRTLGLAQKIDVDNVKFFLEGNTHKRINDQIYLEEAPYLVDDDIVNAIQKISDSGSSDMDKIMKLKEIVFSEPSDLMYDASYTLSAISCFQARSCNCFGITNLLVGTARYLGLDAKYVLIEDMLNRDFMNNHVLFTNHIACQFNVNMDPFVIDTDNEIKRFRIRTVLTDIQAAGLFYCNVAAKYFVNGYIDKAEQIFRIAESLYPGSYQIYYNIGILFMKTENYDEAMKYFQKGIQLSRYPEVFISQIYKIVQKTHDPEKLEQALKELRRIKDRNPYFLLDNKVLPAITKANYREALFQLKKAEEVGKNIPEIYFFIGLCHQRMGNVTLSRKYINKAKTLWAPEIALEFEKIYNGF